MAGRAGMDNTKKRLKLDKGDAAAKYSEDKTDKSERKHKKHQKSEDARAGTSSTQRKSPRESKPSKVAIEDFLESKKARRNDNWQDEEVDALINGVESQWEYINAEQTGVFGSKARTEERKMEAWGSVAQLVNA